MIQVIIKFEDGSFLEYYLALPQDYTTKNILDITTNQSINVDNG